MCAKFGCFRSLRYCNDFPEVSSRTGIAILWSNWAGCRRLDSWDGVITFSVAVVCAFVRLAIGPMSVDLFTLGGGGSTVCGTLELVSLATG